MGLNLDKEITDHERMFLDKEKIKKLLKEMGEFLNFEDLLAIK